MSEVSKELDRHKKTSSKRIEAFDLVRGLHIVFMIMIHVLVWYGAADVHVSITGQSMHFLLGWSPASVFIFMMGVFIIYSDNTNIKSSLKRALGLFLLGYLLNFLRETTPTLFALEFGFVTYEQLGIYTPLRSFLVIDILQFAALAYAICVLLKHYVKNVITWLALAIIVAFGSPFLWDIQTTMPVVNEVLKIFWGNSEEGSLFPLFSWLAYPLAGMVFGYWFKQNNNDKTFFNYIFAIGLSLLVLGSLISFINPSFFIADKMRHGPGLIILLLGVVLLWLWMFNNLVNRIIPNKFFDLLIFWSKNVTSFYFIHWLFVGWGLVVFGAGQLQLSHLFLWMFVVIVLSDLTLRAWLLLSRRKRKKVKPLPVQT